MQKLGDIFLGVKLLSWMTIFFYDLWPGSKQSWMIPTIGWYHQVVGGACVPQVYDNYSII